MRKRLIYKNKIIRLNYFKLELFMKIIKIVLMDQKLGFFFRKILSRVLFRFSDKRRNNTVMRTVCLISGNPRGAYNKFKMSRVQFKRLGEDGFIVGLRKRT
jgi:ribosomal protein S14